MSKGNFDPCFKVTVGEEGRYSGTPHDPGNWSSGEVGKGLLIGTCWGISAPTLLRWVGPAKAQQVTAQYMETLPIGVAKAIYRAWYWDVLKCDDLPAGLDLMVWDFGVNAGTGESAKLLQRLVGVPADGWIGPITLAAVAKFNSSTLIARLANQHIAFYHSLSDFQLFGAGWLARQARIESLALPMATPKARKAGPTTPKKPEPTMTQQYRFRDRTKEWTSYVGMAVAGFAAVIPHLVPHATQWVQYWQAGQMLIGAALMFVPQTPKTEMIENDSWMLLRAFSKQLPPQYAGALQPTIATLAATLVKVDAEKQGVPVPDPAPAPAPVTVVARPIPMPAANPAPAAPQAPVQAVQQPAPAQDDQAGRKPLVADASAALRPF